MGTNPKQNAIQKMENKQDGRYDGVFYQIVQTGGGYEALFDELFSWFRRKTDFFGDQKKAEKCIADAGAKHTKLWASDNEAKVKLEAEAKKREEARKELVKTSEAKVKAEAEAKAKSDAENPAPVKTKETTEAKDGEAKPEGEEKEEDKTPPPKGNGGTTDRYTWTQTLEEAKMTMTFDPKYKGRDFVVKLTPTHLTVGLKNETPIINNEQWIENIDSEESNWILEPTADGQKSLQINIMKWSNRNSWWDSCIKGDPKINTQKIQPETSKVSDLDGEMKGTVEKMMFDMKQKQMGLPSSDDLQKQDKIKDFMKAHPEMDFSKAKIC